MQAVTGRGGFSPIAINQLKGERKMLYSYEMENINGDVATVAGIDGGAASVTFTDDETGAETVKVFENEDRAYSWLYRRGFRE